MRQIFYLHKGVKNLYRALHDPEVITVGYYNTIQFNQTDPAWRAKNGDPEVRWLWNTHNVPMNESWQRTAFDINPGMNPKKWRVLWDWMRAFSNGLGKGFDTRNLLLIWLSYFVPASRLILPASYALGDAYVPVKDYINGRDLNDSSAPDLTKDKVRLCPGFTFEAEEDGDELIVNTFDANLDSPQVQWLYDHPGKTILDFIEAHKTLFFHANTIHLTASKEFAIHPFAQNDGRRVLIPLLARYEVRYPKGACEKVTEIKDPYTIYIK